MDRHVLFFAAISLKPLCPCPGEEMRRRSIFPFKFGGLDYQWVIDVGSRVGSGEFRGRADRSCQAASLTPFLCLCLLPITFSCPRPALGINSATLSSADTCGN